MRLSLTTAVVVAGLCLLVAGVKADGTAEYEDVVKLYRGSSIVASSDPARADYVEGFTHARCMEELEARSLAEMDVRTSGRATYKCTAVSRKIVTFHPAPTCGDRPASDEQEPRDCPAGTVGIWLQDRVWTLQPYPDCWVQGDWTPAEPPEGMCAPNTPPEPEVLPAPTNVRAEGISTSSILVRWDAAAGAAAYSVRRCIGANCEPMERPPLVCTRALEQVHGPFQSTGLTVSYRVQAAATADCSGDLSAPSDPIVRGTALTETTPEPEPEPMGAAALSWTPPTRNTDNSPLTNLAGYYIAYGLSSNALTQSIQLPNPGTVSYTLNNLSPGTYYFAVRAYTSGGTESANSNVVSKVVP